MSVVSCKKRRGGRLGTIDAKRNSKHSCAWIVMTDDPDDTEEDVLEGAQASSPDPVPALLGQHDAVPTARARNISVAQDADDPKKWIITVDFDTTTTEEENHEDPLEREPEVSWPASPFQRPMDKDIHGKPVLNTVGQKFDPTPELDDANPMLVYVRNESAFNVGIAMEYYNTVNSNEFLGAAPGKVRLSPPTAVRVREKDYLYYKVTYEFLFRREGWKKEILNRGTKFRPVAVGDPESPAPNSKLQETADREPVNLKEDGTKVAEGEEFFYVEAEGYEEKDFNALNIIV